MASTISRDMSLLLDQVRTVDVGVRDRDHAGRGGDRHLVIRGADELAREALVPVALVARADAGRTAQEAAEVGGLGEGPLDAGRGDLERVPLPDLAELVGHPLAEVER